MANFGPFWLVTLIQFWVERVIMTNNRSAIEEGNQHPKPEVISNRSRVKHFSIQLICFIDFYFLINFPKWTNHNSPLTQQINSIWWNNDYEKFLILNSILGLLPNLCARLLFTVAHRLNSETPLGESFEYLLTCPGGTWSFDWSIWKAKRDVLNFFLKVIQLTWHRCHPITPLECTIIKSNKLFWYIGLFLLCSPVNIWMFPGLKRFLDNTLVDQLWTNMKLNWEISALKIGRNSALYPHVWRGILSLRICDHGVDEAVESIKKEWTATLWNSIVNWQTLCP